MKINEQGINPIQPYIEQRVEAYNQLPCRELGISSFYEFNIKERHYVEAVPDGAIDLLFNIGEDKVTTYISGTVFGAKKWELGDEDRCFGIRFQSGKGILPADLSMDMLVDNDIEIDGNIFGDNLTEKIACASDINERSEIFKQAYEDLVYSRISLSDKEKINEYIVNRICRAKGQISIKDLEQETNYSACYLRRIFKSYHGISPKQFAQYVRFQNLLKEANNEDILLDQLALDCGYFDEAHMMKEFKKFSGTTVESYRNLTVG